MSVVVPAADMLRMIQRVLHFPRAQICVHSVASVLLDTLERNGMEPDVDFCEAAERIVQAHDEEARAAIGRLLAKHSSVANAAAPTHYGGMQDLAEQIGAFVTMALSPPTMGMVGVSLTEERAIDACRAKVNEEYQRLLRCFDDNDSPEERVLLAVADTLRIGVFALGRD